MARILPVRTLMAAALLGVCLPASGDEFTPRPQQVFTEKPRIEDYADYNAFLVDIMEYRRQKKEREAASRAPSAAPVTDEALSRVNEAGYGDPALYRIERPESLDEALARASKLPHPVYNELERFGRTTSFSFPIPQMEGEDMSANEIPGQLADLDTVEPEVFEDTTAAEHAEATVADNPSNEDETADKRAASGTDEAYQASWDPYTRYVTDSDGRRFWAPIIVPGEAGDTVITVFDLEVTTFQGN